MIPEQPIITTGDFLPYKDISDNIDNVRRVEPYIVQWQRTVLRPALGDEFYRLFVTSLTETRFEQLLNGFDNGVTFFYGLKPAAVYGTYAMLLLNQNFNMTRFGMVKKNNEYSERADDKELHRLHISAQSTSENYLRDAIAYIKENKLLYPEFPANCTETKSSRGGLKVFSIKK